MTLIGRRNFASRLVLALAALFSLGATPGVAQPGGTGLAGTTLLIIRHAEKPVDPGDDAAGGPGLTPAGEARARAYATYFRNFAVDGTPLHIDTLVATADSAKSMRPRLTVEPFSRASGLPLQQPFKNKDVKGLVSWLASGTPHRTVLIAWHHGMVPQLLTELGANPQALIPGGVWPPATFDWVIYLRYGEDGHLAVSKRIVEPAGLAG
jgi:hypothetical protein